MANERATAFIGLGSNLEGPEGQPPRAMIKAALARLQSKDIKVISVSRIYETEPVPPSDQPWFSNAMARIETTLGPQALLARLLDIEASFGRLRRKKWEARVLDLDLVDYDGLVLDDPGLMLPHPHMHERRFVLEPLAEIAPEWYHPVSGLSVGDLLKSVTGQSKVRKT